VSALLARVQPDDPILPRLQEIIERQVVHMARLIDDLVDVSRAYTGKLSLELCDLELTSLVTDAIARCQPAMDIRLQHFTAIIPATPVHLQGDAIRLTQIFTNLLDNASKYTPNAGHLALEMRLEPAQVVISLTDTGIGITRDALPVIFDLFAQDAPAIGFNGAGLGIGLTVVQELVRAHGGAVSATSRGPDRGSQFVVTLPLPDRRVSP
jgi:diguanylate cyclase